MLLSKLIHPKEMYLYKWFVPSNHNDIIFETLDNNLKDIFKLVSNKGYVTLPSCEGHFHSDKSIKHKYNCVLNDFIKITTDKFHVKDIESDKLYYYNNSNYNLPWQSFDEFKNEIKNNMNVGYFGIVNPKGLQEIELDEIKFDFEKVGNYNLLHITVNNLNKNSIPKNWNLVYNILKNKLL